MKVYIAVLCFLLSSTSFGYAENAEPIPLLEYSPKTKTMQTPSYLRQTSKLAKSFALKTPLKTTDVDNIVANLAKVLQSQLSTQVAALSKPVINCNKGYAAVDYQTALWTTGNYKDCSALAVACAAQTSLTTDNNLMRVLVYGAQCSEALYNFKAAHSLYETAIDAKFENTADYAGSVYAFATFAQNTQYESEVTSILAHIKSLTAAELSALKALIEYTQVGKPASAAVAEVEALLPKLFLLGSAYLSSQVHSNWAHILERHRYADDEALVYLDTFVTEIQDALAWLQAGFSAAYGQVGNFRRADDLYKIYYPYTHKASWLPVEQNVYNYYEIHNSVCTGNVTSANYYSWLHYYQQEFTSGYLNINDALVLAEDLDRTLPKQADVLTFIGSLYEQLGDDTKAEAYFFSAHQACPYYNRSHWGLASIKRRSRNKAFDDYSQGVTRIDDALKTVTFSADLEKYIVNWDSLTTEVQKRFKYALRFWAPHVSFLHSQKQSLYAKYDFQLISATPSLYYMSNTRINSGTYSRDNRLWDDVRGLGGKMVVVDIGEMAESAWGAYNLAGHEVAHQFHHSLPMDLQKCIEQLYLNAKARDLFADPYAGSNEGEYFAQGVGYYMTPSTSPARYGLNESWLIKNDADLYQFLTNVTTTADASLIQCPVTIAP